MRAPIEAAVQVPQAKPAGVSSRAWWLGAGAIIVVAGIAAALVVLRPQFLTATRDDGRIEIGAFEPVAKTAELQRFAKGVGDTMVRVLANNDVKAVVSGQAGSETGERANATAEYTLRGSVDRDGGKFIVNANLLHRRDQLVLWSTTMQRDAAEQKTLEIQFSMAVTDVLRCALRFRSAMKNDPSPDVFGRLLGICSAFGEGRLDRAQELATAVVAFAPQDAFGYALRAALNASLSNQAISGVRKPREEVARLRKMVYDDARIAERLDPQANSYYARAVVDDPAVGLAAREKLLLKSLEVDPTSYARQRYYDLLGGVGRNREALDQVERASNAAPLDAQAATQAAFYAAYSGNIELARKRLQDARSSLAPEAYVNYLQFWAELFFGDPTIAKKIDDAPHEVYWQGSTKMTVGSYGACLRAFIDARVRNVRLREAELDAVCPDGDPNVYGYFGYVGAALRQWEAHIDPSLYTLGGEFLLFAPFQRPMRADPRFMHLAARQGLVDYWLDSGKWPDFCKDDTLPYDCKQAALAVRASLRGKK